MTMQENAKIAKLPSLDKVIENPALVAGFDETTNREVLEGLLDAIGPVLARFVKDMWAHEVDKVRESGDRLLSREEMAERLHCTVQHISRGWRAGRYPFMLKDGARLVGSEDGLERWIKNRIKKVG